jgi:zinc protease
MRHLFAFLVLLFVTSALCLIAPVPARAADIKNLDLGKNAQVWFAEDHTVPIVAVVAALPAGSAYDPGAKGGLATFAAALVDEGAGNMDSRAFHEALADHAIQFRANVERDYMVISVVSLSENLPEAMKLLQTALTRPRFDAEAVARVRTQILQSLAQDQSEPPTMARRAFSSAFFNGHPYGHASDGDAAGIQAITLDDLKIFAKNHWVRGGIKISVSGDITDAAAAKLIADTFKPVPETIPSPPPPVGRLGQPGVHIVNMAVPQPTVIFGLPGIMRADPDFITGYVANYILGGGGFSSRLMDEVRVKRGLTYGIATELAAYNRASIMEGSVATRADAVRQTISVVRDTMAGFAANGATQQELDDAKTYLTGSFPLAFASTSGIAAQLNTFQRQNLDIGYVARRNSLIQAVTLADVKRVAKRLFDPARLTVVVAGTPLEGRPAAEAPKAPVRPTPAPVAGLTGNNVPLPAAPGGTPAAPPPGVKPVIKPMVKPPVTPGKPAAPGP